MKKKIYLTRDRLEYCLEFWNKKPHLLPNGVWHGEKGPGHAPLSGFSIEETLGIDTGKIKPGTMTVFEVTVRKVG